MEPEPIFEKTIALPMGYVITARARPSTIRRTAVKLLPWALVIALPQGGLLRKVALSAAMRFAPMVKQKLR